MKYTLLALALTLCIGLNAQIESYRLDSITNPKYRLNILEFDIALNQNFNGNVSDNSTSTTKNNSNNFYGLFSPSYSSILNSKKYQGSQNSQLKIDGNSNFQSSGTNNELNKGIALSIIHSSNHRFYLSKSKKNHIVLNPNANIYYQQAETGKNPTNGNDFDRSIVRNNLDLSSEIGYGHGRLENVSDARIILFILEDLKKQGLLKKEPSHEEINALANLAITIKNKRFFDARIKRIYELTKIDSLLNEQGLIEKENIEYHTILQDNWNFAVNSFRQTGWLFQYGIKPTVRINETINTNTFENILLQPNGVELNNSKITNYNFSLFTKYEWHKPISQSLQNNVALSVASGLANNNIQTETIFEDVTTLQNSNNSNHFQNTFTIRDEFGFYPTNRTYFSIHGEVNYTLNSEYKSDLSEISNKQQQVHLGSGINAYYYFSPQLRITINCGLNYYSSHSSDFDVLSNFETGYVRNLGWNSNLGLRLVYKLF